MTFHEPDMNLLKCENKNVQQVPSAGKCKEVKSRLVENFSKFTLIGNRTKTCNRCQARENVRKSNRDWLKSFSKFTLISYATY